MSTQHPSGWTAYRLRPVVVIAFRYDGSPEAQRAVELAMGRPSVTTDDPGSLLVLDHGQFARPGDWIVRGVQGDFSAVAPDLFHLTYEPAPEFKRR